MSFTPEAFDALPQDQQDAITMAVFGETARLAFDLESYEAFHWCIYKHTLEPHERVNLQAYFDEWDKSADEGIRGVLNKAARGLFKSTDTAGFLMFVIGHFPHLSNLVIQARDKDAQKTHNFIAETIESNKGWKAAFPNVVPDKDRGWSLNGCHVKKTHDIVQDGDKWKITPIPYDEWVRTVTNNHQRDPSFLCVSVVAGAIGMHPTGCLVMDDIHDSKNTESLAEMAATVSTVKSDIIPTMTSPGKKPLLLVAYTPWKEDDAYAVLENSGLFRQLVTPAYIVDDDGKNEFDGQKVTLTCPKVYSEVVLEQQLKLLGFREFNRQLRCLLGQGTGVSLPYYSYVPSGDEWKWSVVAGADPNGPEKNMLEKTKELSHFAIAYIGRSPQGGAVVLDGYLEQSTYLDADSELLSAQNRYPNMQYTMVESVGTGLAYLAHARRTPDLKVVPSDVAGLKEKIVKSKDHRIMEMGVWFENGTLKIADKDTPFLNALRYLFNHIFELNKNYAHPAWDAGDAVYAALKGMPDVLQIRRIASEIRQPGEKRKMSLSSAWSEL